MDYSIAKDGISMQTEIGILILGKTNFKTKIVRKKKWVTWEKGVSENIYRGNFISSRIAPASRIYTITWVVSLLLDYSLNATPRGDSQKFINLDTFKIHWWKHQEGKLLQKKSNCYRLSGVILSFSDGGSQWLSLRDKQTKTVKVLR